MYNNMYMTSHCSNFILIHSWPDQWWPSTIQSVFYYENSQKQDNFRFIKSFNNINIIAV